MKSRIEEPSDLLSLARRGPLTREESHDLSAWIDETPEARLLSEAATVFDKDSSAQPGDDALLARIASRAAHTQRRPSVLRRRTTILLLAAALVLVGTAAAGGSLRVRRGAMALLEYFRGSQVTASSDTNGATAQQVQTPQAIQPSEPPARPAPPVEVSASSGDLAASPAEAVRSRAAASRDPGEIADKASSLFGRANARRLAGDDAAAIALYRELADRYAGTPQALMAEMALGKLLMAKGDAAGALPHFRRYSGAGGPLGVEALWGEANALRALGRTGEERRVLEQLLDRYPDSAYSNAARKRLGPDAP